MPNQTITLRIDPKNNGAMRVTTSDTSSKTVLRTNNVNQSTVSKSSRKPTRPTKTSKKIKASTKKQKIQKPKNAKKSIFSMGSFKNESLARHNEHRRNHGTPALKWNSKLEADAQRWANSLAKKGYMQHENQNEQGENIAVMKGTELTGGKATDMWYSEVKDYSFNKPGFNSKTGHFTQVVWAESRELGMAKAVSNNGMEFVVARYLPPGNTLGTFPNNVKPQGSSSSSKPTTNNNITSPTTREKKSPAKSNKSPTKKTNKTAKVEGRESDKEFRSAIQRSHNMYRQRHGAPPLKWSNTLAAAAFTAAEEAARTNTLRSVDMQDVGQNMAAMTGGELTGDKVTSMWYDEERNFNYNDPGFSSSTGSFTQLVWKGTREVGVARAFGSQGQTFVVALYKSPGNIRGQYNENIGKPTGPVPTLAGKDKGCSNCTIL